MIAEITPLRRLPRTTSVFDYTVPHDMTPTIKIGQGVSISFRTTRSVTGIVIALKEQPFNHHIPLKSIKKILPDLTLQPWHLALAQWLTAYYHCSLSTALKMVLR